MLPPRLTLWKDRSIRFAMGAGSTVVTSLLGIVRNKWLALHLEASGLGVLAQVTSGQAWLGMLAGMGLNLPVAQLVAAGDADLARRAVWSSITLVAIGGFAVASAGLIFAGAISQALLGTPEHAMLIRISMLGVAGMAVQGVLMGLFAGRSDVKANFTLAATGALTAALVTLALVPRWGLAGGALGIALVAPAGALAALLAHRGSYAGTLSPRPSPLFDRTLVRSLLGVGSAALVMTLVTLGTMLAVRAHYLRWNGIGANGLLQAALAIAQQVGTLFYTYLSTYAFGRVSAAAATPGPAGRAEVRAYTRRHWTPLLLLATAAFATAMVVITPLLHLLYSSRFDGARSMLAWALLGEFLRVAMNVWAVGALPIGGARLWLPVGLSTSLGLAGAYALLFHTGGGLSLPYAYLAAGAFSLVFSGIAMSLAGVTLGLKEFGVAAACTAALTALALAVAR
jgi:O-antigen/teichoic acid export membrane protein